MSCLERVGTWFIRGIVIVSVAVVFDAIGKGVLDLSSEESLIFAPAAAVVATFLYRRHTTTNVEGSPRRTEAIKQAVIIGILMMLLTIPSKIRAIPDVSSEVSSIHEGVSSLQDQIDELKDKLDSVGSRDLPLSPASRPVAVQVPRF